MCLPSLARSCRVHWWLYLWQRLQQRVWEPPCLARSNNRYRYDGTINNNCWSVAIGDKRPRVPSSTRSPDVGVLPCPGSECFQLALGLTHPRIEEVELSKCLCTCPCIAVHWVISRRRNTVIKTKSLVTEKTTGPFVVLNEADNIVLYR